MHEPLCPAVSGVFSAKPAGPDAGLEGKFFEGVFFLETVSAIMGETPAAESRRGFWENIRSAPGFGEDMLRKERAGIRFRRAGVC